MAANRAAAMAAQEVEMGELLAASSDEAEPRSSVAPASNRRILATILAAGSGLGLLGLATFARRSEGAATLGHADASAAISLQAMTTPLPYFTTPPALAGTPPPGGFIPTSSPLAAMCNPKAPTNTMQRTENMNDKNVCRDSEEESGGLCYRKCSCLTGNPKAKRMTAFSCCVTDDCTDMTAWATPSLEPCTSFDLSSADGGTACPHQPGACLEDEEQSWGMCFKRCSLIDNAYPFRVNAMTCCKANPSTNMGCQPLIGDPDLYITGADYNVGGGCGDANPSDTPCSPHAPLTSQTESS